MREVGANASKYISRKDNTHAAVRSSYLSYTARAAAARAGSDSGPSAGGGGGAALRSEQGNSKAECLSSPLQIPAGYRVQVSGIYTEPGLALGL